jgi:tetratricopeptide (TPR) repeat protein
VAQVTARLAVALAAAVAVGIAGAGGAAAQSTRYPPEPFDADKAAAERSDFWERALEPDRGRYDVLLARARRLIDARTPQDLAAAIEQIDQAIALLPDVADGHYLRGWAHELLLDWAACADDYGAAATRDPAFELSPNPRTRGGLADGLGVCLSRAGRFEEAEEVLAQATAAGGGNAGLWLRLAEVDMALGRLDDAISALAAALKLARSTDVGVIHWYRAMAFDRARRPADAEEAAAAALVIDSTLRRVLDPALPSAPPEDQLYLAGIALAAHTAAYAARPEHALLYFREYVERARKSPWRKRAEEHIAELQKVDPIDALGRPGGWTGTVAYEAARVKPMRKDLVALAACMKDTPRVVAEVRIVLHGPPAPPPKRGQPIILTGRPPAAGATAKILAQVGEQATAADLGAATKCLEQAAGKLKGSKLERGRWVQLTLPVIYR